MVGFTHMHPGLPIVRSLIIFYISPFDFPSSLKGCLQLVRSFGCACHQASPLIGSSRNAHEIRL